MSRKPIELATRSFTTSKEATEFFRAILHRFEPGDILPQEAAVEITALLERHPKHAQKIGCGVLGFQVRLTEYGNDNRCFYILRTDGTFTDFSYLTCIRGRPPTRKTEVSQAFRRTVEFEIYDARQRFFAEHESADGLFACAVTGERIARQHGHMDHRPPMTFEVIVTTFLAARGMSWDAVPITTGRDNQIGAEITDDSLTKAFRSYHGNVARLDFVKAHTNLAQSAKYRLRQSRISLTSRPEAL